MNRLVENQIKFFDSVSLFFDIWLKYSDLQVRFNFSTHPNQTKAIFTFPTDNQDLVTFFKEHLKKYFQSRHVNYHIVLNDSSAEIFLTENGFPEDVGKTSQMLP
jgi:ATP phosphoribosyltransferase